VLADLNVPLPAVAAQGLVLVILVFVTIYLARGARDGENRLKRLAQTVGSLAAMTAAIAIVYAWVDALVAPPSRQLVGVIVGAPVDSVRIELVDYRGDPVAATVDRDRGSGQFLISYAPEFADPPSAVVVAATRCGDGRRIPLRRPQLKRGAAIGVHLECGGTG
jgi:hypothetical protein